MREIAEHKIKIYEFPETDDEEENRLVKKIKVACVTWRDETFKSPTLYLFHIFSLHPRLQWGSLTSLIIHYIL